jgi:multiple sugar transport system permease protein
LRNIWNSVYIALMATLTTLFCCSLGGFGFAMYAFRFKSSSLRPGRFADDPALLGVIPYYLIIQELGWLDTPQGGLVSRYGERLRHLFYAPVHRLGHLEGADGRRAHRRASEFRIYWNIVVPLIRPAWRRSGS